MKAETAARGADPMQSHLQPLNRRLFFKRGTYVEALEFTASIGWPDLRN